ncbi:DUF5693 family protein [Elusimicrobiota bacterium]
MLNLLRSKNNVQILLIIILLGALAAHYFANKPPVCLLIVIPENTTQNSAIVEKRLAGTISRNSWHLTRKPGLQKLPQYPVSKHAPYYFPDLKDFLSFSSNYRSLLAHYLRAYRERSMRIMAYWLDNSHDLSCHLATIKRIRDDFASRNISLGNPKPILVKDETAHILIFRMILACLITMTFPFAICLWAIRNQRLESPDCAFAIMLIAGICAWILLQSDPFVLRLSRLGFIEISMILPMLAMLAWLMKSDSLPIAAHNKALYMSVFAVFFIVSILRLRESLPISGFETGIRDFMDVEIGIRPRLREIIGWFCWSFFGCRSKAGLLKSSALFSIFGPISTANSFLHAHTPLPFIIIRSTIGFFIGYALAFAAKKTLKCTGLAT